MVIVAGNLQDMETYEKLKVLAKNSGNLRLIVKWIPDDELQVYFNAADIVVLPYTQIYTSGVIPLAYAFKRAVITSDVGPMREVVNERTGILVPPKDSQALRMAIEALFEKNYLAMGEYAHSYAESMFDWDRNAREVIGLYEEILKA